MNDIQVYLFDILCLGNCLPAERGGGESSVPWSLAGLSLGYLKKGDTQHSETAVVHIRKTPTQIPTESFKNRNVAGAKTAQWRLFFLSL